MDIKKIFFVNLLIILSILFSFSGFAVVYFAEQFNTDYNNCAEHPNIFSSSQFSCNIDNGFLFLNNTADDGTKYLYLNLSEHIPYTNRPTITTSYDILFLDFNPSHSSYMGAWRFNPSPATAGGVLANNRIYECLWFYLSEILYDYNYSVLTSDFIHIDVVHNQSDNLEYLFIDGVFINTTPTPVNQPYQAFGFRNYHHAYVDNVIVQSGAHINEDLYYAPNSCPFDLCLFYEDYINEDYTLLHNTLNYDYTGNTDLCYIKNQKLYFNTTNSTETPYFQYTLPLDDKNKYNNLIFNIEFSIFNYLDGINNQPVVYAVSLLSLSDVSIIDNYVYLTQLNNGSIELLVTDLKGNTLIFDNFPFNSDKILQYDINFDTQRVNIKSISESNLFTGSFGSYSQVFNNPVNYFDNFQIGRIDYTDNISVMEYSGINTISLYGADFNFEISKDTEIYKNVTAIYEVDNNASLPPVKKSIHEFASFLCFRNADGRIIFVLFFIFIGLISIAKMKNIDTRTKTILAVVIPVLIMFIFWYLEFIPTSIIIIMVFIFSVIGAIFLRRLFGGSEENA